MAGLGARAAACNAVAVNGNELLRKLRRLARRRNVDFDFDPTGGTGGHGPIVLGARRTIRRSSRYKELPTGSVHGMLAELGIEPKDLG
jgi:mRNA interferase HicA